MPKAVCIIPARLASERFPRKVLACETGWPLIRHVWEAARRAHRVERIVIAADAQEIADACAGFGAECVMTRPDHPNGTSRLHEAATLIGLADDAIVVNVQGDEPEIEPHTVDACVEALAGSPAEMATLASPITSVSDVGNPNIVKVVRRLDGLAMYFSRAPIPHARDEGDRALALRHVGIYAYSCGFLGAYAGLPPTPSEQAERLEQLRALEHGLPIAVGLVESTHVGIDTPEQYAAFVERWRARLAGG